MSWKGTLDWCYTDVPNKFNAIPNNFQSQTTSDLAAEFIQEAGVKQIKFYVYGSVTEQVKSIAVKVKPTDSNIEITTALNGSSNFHSKVDIAALTPTNFSGSEINLDKQALVPRHEYRDWDVGAYNAIYTYTWAMPRNLRMLEWAWEDYGPNQTPWSKCCYYMTGYKSDGAQRDWWMAVGSIYPPGNYPDLSPDNEIGDYPGIDPKLYSIQVSADHLVCTKLLFTGFTWSPEKPDVSNNGHAVIVTDQYGNKYRLHFSAGSNEGDPQVTSTLLR